MLNNIMEKLDPARSLISPPELGMSFHDFKTPERQTIVNCMTFPVVNFQSYGLPTPATTSKQIDKGPDESSTTPLSPPQTPGTPISMYNRDASEDPSKRSDFNDPQLYSSSSDIEIPLFPPTEDTVQTPVASINQVQPKLNTVFNAQLTGCSWTITMANPSKRLQEELKWRQQRKLAREAYLMSSRKTRIVNVVIPRTPQRREKPFEVVKSSIKKPVHRVHKPSLPKRPKQISTTRTNVDFESIPDMCPPLSSLDLVKVKKIPQWKGSMLDLSDDEYRHLLHKFELDVASRLRLSCTQYLSSKRLIFEARVQYAKEGSDFKKTDSQKACSIDVNKASKLWEVFNSVGWFDEKWIQPYL